MKLYHFPESGNSWKAKFLISHLDLPADIIPMAGLKGATRNDTFKAKNVDQRLPLLEQDDGTFLSESDAILFYLAQDTSLWSEDLNEQAQILRWMFFEQSRIEATVAVVRFQMAYSPEAKRILPFENELRRRALEALQVMEDHLEGKDFFVSNRFTIADIALYAYTHVAGEADIDLAAFPNILNWIKRVEESERFIPFTER